jgi:hypothetical protein
MLALWLKDDDSVFAAHTATIIKNLVAGNNAAKEAIVRLPSLVQTLVTLTAISDDAVRGPAAGALMNLGVPCTDLKSLLVFAFSLVILTAL